MKNKLLYLLILVALLISGCEQPLSDEEFPFEEKIVIRGLIEDGKKISKIYVGKTLPVGVKYSIEHTYLDSASVVIIHNGNTYPMFKDFDGTYASNLIPVKGETYKIVVTWKEKMAYAETTVPSGATINQTALVAYSDAGKSKLFVTVNIVPKEGECYAATWTLLNSVNGKIELEGTEFREVKIKESNPNLTIVSNSFQNSIDFYEYGYGLYIYDDEFYSYYKTQNSGNIGEAIFGSAGVSTIWNIKGDGIGLFIARIVVQGKI